MSGTRPVTGLLLLGLMWWGAGQEPRQDEYTVRLRSTLVTVKARALTSEGRIIEDLRKEDFLLYEDRVLQEITQFERQERSLAVAFMIDTSGSMKVGNLLRARLAAKQVILHLQEGEEIALFNVGEKPELILPLTTDREGALRTLNFFIQRMTALPDLVRGSGLHVHDAVYAGANYLKEASKEKQRVLILATDNGTTPPNARSATEALHEALEADVVIIGLITAPLSQLNRLIHGDVKDYARETGGEAFSVHGGEGLLKVTGLLERLRIWYLLAYSSTNLAQGEQLRQIRLELSRAAQARYGKVKLLYRRRYYPAGPPRGEFRARSLSKIEDRHMDAFGLTRRG